MIHCYRNFCEDVEHKRENTKIHPYSLAPKAFPEVFWHRVDTRAEVHRHEKPPQHHQNIYCLRAKVKWKT